MFRRPRSAQATDRHLALTFDSCGRPGNNDIDESLVGFLIAQRIPATLFSNKRWIDANPARAAQLALNPVFELADNGVAHKPLWVTGRVAYGIADTGSVWEAADQVGRSRPADHAGSSTCRQWPEYSRSFVAE
ncbi:polysaccharide deacetylase family protein [Nocardia sp. NPDC023852]|uniref:polysaccharide deacetylase family protein n=1 Tax=Nocardia sp. NPDC023852 TaxID=3154697 RepID=UPI0033CEDA9C